MQQPDYEKAVEYWSSQPGTVDGMLGGYGTGRVPRLDVQHSSLFLRQLISAGHLAPCRAYRAKHDTQEPHAKRLKLSPPQSHSREPDIVSVETNPIADHGDRTEETGSCHEALIETVDCGAGIGRVTRDLLVDFSDAIDLVEPCAPFTDTILRGPDLKGAREEGTVRDVWTLGLQDFRPRPYNLIWNQWCLGQLNDTDLVAYLTRCRGALKDDKSCVFVKENIAQVKDIFDEDDSSWTRTEEHFLEIFKAAGLKVIKSSLQHGFPKELFRVKLWALKSI